MSSNRPPMATTAKSTTSSAAGLEVQVLNRGLIKASRLSQPPSYILSLSNFDFISGNHPATIVHIYPPRRNHTDDHSPTSIIKTNLPPFLDHFFPFTGRITTNPLTNKPQVLCNNQGAELIEARADARLADTDFRHLNTSLDLLVLPYPPDIALCVQVVHFSCGGFSVAWSTNHMLADATGLSHLSCSWAEFVRTGRMAGQAPGFDRSVLHPPRSPPRFSPALDRSYATVTGEDMINVLSAAGMLSAGVYYVESSDVNRLRSLASRTHRRSTRIQAFSAHVWKVLANAVGEADTSCRLGWFVDGRRWLGLGEGYMGNVLSCVSGEARVKDLISEPLALVAEKVEASIAKTANQDHFLDLMDLVECRIKLPVSDTHALINRVNLGLGSPAIILSSCHHLPVGSEFGFGQAALAAFHSTGSERLGMGFMQIAPSTKGDDGPWVVSTHLWPKVARALESDPFCAFKPLTAEYLELHRPTTTSRL